MENNVEKHIEYLATRGMREAISCLLPGQPCIRNPAVMLELLDAVTDKWLMARVHPQIDNFVLAKGQGIAPEQGHSAYESVRTELVGLGFHKRLAFRGFNVAKVLVEPKDNPRATDFLGDCVESVGGVREHVAATDDGMYVGGLAGIPQHGERFVLDHVGEQVRKRIGARIDDKIAVLGQQRLHQQVEPLGIDDSGLISQRNMAHGERRVMRESRVFLVGVEAAHRTRLVDHVLRQQRADERFADAAFGLQDKMNCVLHEILISKDRECRAD